MPTFQTYLDDLNSSTGCCRSASILIPTKGNDANAILRTLQKWNWTCRSVLVRPWSTVNDEAAASGCASLDDGEPWYFRFLPTEHELLRWRGKFASHEPNPSPSSRSTSMREDLMRYHIHSKSLLVPLTDGATAFILRVLFELPCVGISTERDAQHGAQQHITSFHGTFFSDPERYYRAITVQKWSRDNTITLVHNCDGNQTVSLSKEVDLFPESALPLSMELQSNNHFTFADLFAGIGGFRIGLEALGGVCVGSCEVDQYARDTYRRNFLQAGDRDGDSQEFFVNDITRLEIPPYMVDVLSGGFPCQSFSSMASFGENDTNGESTNKERRGGLETEDKGKLFFHLLRILRKSKPKAFVFENVKGLMNLDGGSHFRKILQLLEESGYSVTHGMVDSSWFLPQRRERVYFVGIRLDLLEGENCNYQRSLALHLGGGLQQKYQIFGNDIAEDIDKLDRVLIQNGMLRPTATTSTRSLPTSRLADILESWEAVTEQHPHCFLSPSRWEKVRSQGYLQVHLDGSGQLLTEDDACAQTLVSSYRRSHLLHSQFVVTRDSWHLVEQRQRLLAEAQKLKSQRDLQERRNESTGGELTNYNDRTTLPRFFTPRECCRLQGFPEDFILPFPTGESRHKHLISQFYRQIGNAVSPPCVAAVAEGALPFLMSNCEDVTENAVFDLVIKANPDRVNILHTINGKIK